MRVRNLVGCLASLALAVGGFALLTTPAQATNTPPYGGCAPTTGPVLFSDKHYQPRCCPSTPAPEALKKHRCSTPTPTPTTAGPTVTPTTKPPVTATPTTKAPATTNAPQPTNTPADDATPPVVGTGPTLPLTGAGAGIVAAIGAAALVVGAGVFMVGRRRRTKFTA